ncbi:hypothetical protein D3C81_386240 [compost metagenome]
MLAGLRGNANLRGRDGLHHAHVGRHFIVDDIGQCRAVGGFGEVVLFRLLATDVFLARQVHRVITHACGRDDAVKERQVLLQENRLGGGVILFAGIGRDAAWHAGEYRVGDIDGGRQAVDRALFGRRVEVLDAHQRAAVDVLELGIVLQHQVAIELIGIAVGAEDVAWNGGANTRSVVAQVDIAEVIGQLAVAQVAAQGEAVVEVVGNVAAQAGALDIVEVVAGLAVEVTAVVLLVQRVATAVRRAVGLQVIQHHRGRGEVGRRPGQAAHHEAVIVLRMVVLAVAVLHLGREAAGQGLFVVQCIAYIDPGFGMVIGAVGHVALAKLLEARLLGHEVDRATRVCRAEQGGVGTPQNFDTLVGVRVFAHTTHRAEGQAVSVGGGLEAADQEVVVAVVRTVVVADHAGGVLQRFFGGADAALLHFLVGHHRHGRGRVEDAGRYLAANPQLLGNHRVGVIVGAGLDLGIDDDRCQAVVLGRAQFQRAGRLRLRYYQVRIGALRLKLQLGSAQQRRQRRLCIQRALHPVGIAVGHVLRIERKADTRLARKAVQCRRQRARGNAPLLERAVVISAQRLCKRRQCVGADCQAQQCSMQGTTQGVALWNRGKTHSLAPCRGSAGWPVIRPSLHAERE